MFQQDFTVQFDQVVPKPLCSTGPFDWVYVNGPIQFTLMGSLTQEGEYSYESRLGGKVSVTPVDITQNPPIPVGEPFMANVEDRQHGSYVSDAGRVEYSSRRIAPQGGGTELQHSRLVVSTNGRDSYRSRSHCLTE